MGIAAEGFRPRHWRWYHYMYAVPGRDPGMGLVEEKGMAGDRFVAAEGTPGVVSSRGRRRAGTLGAALAVSLIALPAAYPQNEFRRGDINTDTRITLADVILGIRATFLGAWIPCRDALDLDDNGAIQIVDFVRLLAFVFHRGPPPAAPFLECGLDSGNDDPLSCCEFDPCGFTCVTLSDEDLIDPALIPDHICVPSPLFEDEVAGMTVIVCPEGKATCDGSPGCQVNVESVEFSYDDVNRLFNVHVVAGAPGLPFDIKGLLSASCTAQVTWEIRAVVRVLTETSECGYPVIIGLDLEVTQLESDATIGGPFPCGLTQALFPLLDDYLIGFIESTFQEMIDEAGDLPEFPLCPE